MAILDFFKRKATKTVTKRNYAGANQGRLFADFVTSSKSPDAEISPAIVTLRNRCRDLARNNEYAKRFISLLKANVVGETGVNIQVKARLSNAGGFDNIGNSIVETGWANWGKLGNCTVDGKMTWLDAQRMFIECLARDGEVLIKKVRNYANKDGFALQFIEPDLLDDKYTTTLPDGSQIRMGVEVDKYGRPTAYHILNAHPYDLQYATAMNTQRVRVPADDIIHVFMQERAGQSRGVPMMATAISSLKMLAGYREAELVAARVGASKMGFFTSPEGDGFTGDGMEDEYVPIMEAAPATFHQLPKGVDFKAFDPTHPPTAFADFEKAILRGIASGLGVSYNSLSNDLEGVSYSSIRQGTLEDRDHYKTLQQFMIQHFVEPIFREWLTMAMTKASINLPITRFDKFADATSFRPRGFNWVDPLKEINAAVVGLENGILSMQDVANQYGRDIEETFDQISREKEMAKQFGISFAFEPFGQKLPANPQVVNPQDDQVQEPQPQARTEQVINLNPEFIVKSDPIELNLNLKHDDKPTRSKKITLVRGANGAVIGAESIEE